MFYKHSSTTTLPSDYWPPAAGIPPLFVAKRNENRQLASHDRVVVRRTCIVLANLDRRWWQARTLHKRSGALSAAIIFTHVGRRLAFFILNQRRPVGGSHSFQHLWETLTGDACRS